MATDARKIPALPFLIPGALSLLAALWAGLLRLPWHLGAAEGLSSLHGPLMICGFLATVIIVERAVALKSVFHWLAAVFCGGGAILLIASSILRASAPSEIIFGIGAWLFVLGAIGLTGIFIEIIRRQPVVFNYIMAGGSLFLLLGNIALLRGVPIPQIYPFWAAFLLLTIGGERIELNRMMPPKPLAMKIFYALLGIYCLGVLATIVEYQIGSRVSGFGMVGLAFWFWKNDIARRTVKMEGLARYVAVCLLSGYFWLLFSGAIILGHGPAMSGPVYDSIVHSMMIGFVISMIFGHAPIILPSVLNLNLRYGSQFYVPLALLHSSLLLRLIGDMSGMLHLRRWGGMINALVIVLFLIMAIRAIQQRTD
jgi:hypothetical protein